jgi:predicted glycosyltransferase
VKVWIDLANSPHVLLFGPVAERLAERGHTVAITARDHAQTLELALERWPDASVIGGPSPPGRIGKVRQITGRTGALRKWARAERVDVALSHNSYAQIVAARTLGLWTVTAMDYEFQPANHLAFRLASLVVLPQAFPAGVATRQGANPRKTRRYAGFKEEAYLDDAEPDVSVLEQLGISRDETPIVVLRTPPSGATYHQFENQLFDQVLDRLATRSDVVTVVLPRNADQRHAVRKRGGESLVVPDHAIDSRSLIAQADLFIGAGGTMTREASIMGVPTLTVFAGRRPAVDQELERIGGMARLTSLLDLDRELERAEGPHRARFRDQASDSDISNALVDAVEAARV